MKVSQQIILIFSLPLITHCASLVKGSDQVITVDTPNCPGATCRLTNNDGTYFVNNTPGTVTINKSGSDLNISCYKEGNVSSAINTESNVENMAWGNILIGGIIGGGVDMATGAAYNYPNFIEHPLDCRIDNNSQTRGGLKLKSNELSQEEKIRDLEKAIEELKKEK